MWKHQFGVFIDNKGVWRCCGHLDNADIPDSSKHPILLDAKYHITALIVKACHEKVLHGGVKSTLTELCSRYWAVKRSLVKKSLHRCVICRRFNGRPYLPPPPPHYLTSGCRNLNHSLSPKSATALCMVGPDISSIYSMVGLDSSQISQQYDIAGVNSSLISQQDGKSVK